MNKWKIIEGRKKKQGSTNDPETAVWEHYGSDDDDSDLAGWLQDGWKVGSSGWLQDGWRVGSSGWLQDGWRVGSSSWLQDGWKVGSSGWLQDGWHAGHGSYTGSDSTDYSGYSSDTGPSTGSDGSSGSTRRRKANDRVGFPWISLIGCILMYCSNGNAIDGATIFFGIIFIINFVRWIRQ